MSTESSVSIRLIKEGEVDQVNVDRTISLQDFNSDNGYVIIIIIMILIITATVMMISSVR